MALKDWTKQIRMENVRGKRKEGAVIYNSNDGEYMIILETLDFWKKPTVYDVKFFQIINSVRTENLYNNRFTTKSMARQQVSKLIANTKIGKRPDVLPSQKRDMLSAGPLTNINWRN